MDPLADKVLVMAAMCWFVECGKMPGWVLAIVLLREFAVSPEIPGYTSPEDQERTKEKLESMGLSQFDLFRYVVFEKERTADDRI